MNSRIFDPAALLALLVFGSHLLMGCATNEAPGMPGSGSSMAHDKIMLVRREPRTLGYDRMVTHVRQYPAFGGFLGKFGHPDFLAETAASGRHIWIAYYLRDLDAYVFRNVPGHPGQVVYAGPYPITPNERKLLDGVRKQAGM